MCGLLQLYIEGYIQAMLDTVYRQEYLRVRVIDNQVIVKLCVHIDGEVCIGDFLKLDIYVEIYLVLRMLFAYMCMI